MKNMAEKIQVFKQHKTRLFVVLARIPLICVCLQGCKGRPPAEKGESVGNGQRGYNFFGQLGTTP